MVDTGSQPSINSLQRLKKIFEQSLLQLWERERGFNIIDCNYINAAVYSNISSSLNKYVSLQVSEALLNPFKILI